MELKFQVVHVLIQVCFDIKYILMFDRVTRSTRECSLYFSKGNNSSLE